MTISATAETLGRHRDRESDMDAAPLVAIVTFPGVQILDVTGPLEVFSTATRLLPQATYRTVLVSTHGGDVAASCGMRFATTAIADLESDEVDTLVVAGGRDMDEPAADDHLVEHLQSLAAQARRVTAVCSGAFLLAAAGLLEGRRATTHWAECHLLEQGYPDTTVDPDAIYVRDDNIWTSAGVTAGIDLTLALLADDHGRQAAATVARQLVVYLRRSGGQSQFSDLLAAQAADSEPIRDLLTWLPDHLDHDLSVPGRPHPPLTSSDASSNGKSAPTPSTTSKPCGCRPPAPCSKPPSTPSTTSPAPAASEHPRP